MSNANTPAMMAQSMAESLLRENAALKEQNASWSFQERVQPWMMACFGPEISADRIERNHRFLEESLELVQSLGCTRSEAHQLVEYVFSRPVGEPKQESGGVMVTHAALCLAAGLDMHESGEVELARIMQPEVMEKIRAKQAAKPKYSPLPVVTSSQLDKNAARYLWLRKQHWNESELCVVARPKEAVKLGYDCPSLERLDEAIDSHLDPE